MAMFIERSRRDMFACRHAAALRHELDVITAIKTIALHSSDLDGLAATIQVVHYALGTCIVG